MIRPLILAPEPLLSRRSALLASLSAVQPPAPAALDVALITFMRADEQGGAALQNFLFD